jgi:hypothetical protein
MFFEPITITITILSFLTLKNDQEQDPENRIRMDPHWFGFPDPDPFSTKKLDPHPHWIHNTAYTVL